MDRTSTTGMSLGVRRKKSAISAISLPIFGRLAKGLGTLSPAIPLKPNYGLNGPPSICCEFSRRHLSQCPVVWCFPRLSKLLNQENALSDPCLGNYFYSPQAPSRDAGMLRIDLIRRFDVTLLLAITEPSCRQALMLSRWLSGRCTGRERRCNAKQGRHGKTALTCGYLLTQ